MAGRSRLTATPAQVLALRELARSAIRGEADRARAILLTLDGWTSVELAQAFGVTAASVRHWRSWFAAGGVEALRATLAPGPSPERGERALAVARELLSGPVENRTNWTLPRLRAEIGRRAGITLSTSRLGILLREKGGSAGGGPGIR
jgi:transposase